MAAAAARWYCSTGAGTNSPERTLLTWAPRAGRGKGDGMRSRSIRTGRHALGAVAGGLALTLVLAACGSSPSSKPQPSAVSHAPAIPAGPIKVGALFSLTGAFAQTGLITQATYQAIIAHLNAAGGIADHQVQLVALNDQGNPAVAVSQAERLVADHVAAVVYPGLAITDRQTVPVFMKSHIPVVTLAPSDQWANGKEWPYYFDAYPLNKPTMATLVAFGKARGITKLGVLGDSTPFSQSLMADLVPSARQAHLPIVATAAYTPTSTDMTVQLQQLRSAGANGIALLAETGMTHVHQDLLAMGWHPTILTTADAFFDGYSSLGALAPNTYANCGIGVKPGQALPPAVSTLMQTVAAKIHITIPGNSGIIFINNTMLILAYAIEHAHSLNGNAIASAIESIHGVSFTAPQYSYTFTASNHDGWPANAVHMCRLVPLGPQGLPILATP